MSDWQPETYLKFADERTRPARDLLAQVPLDRPGVVYDLAADPATPRSFCASGFRNPC